MVVTISNMKGEREKRIRWHPRIFIAIRIPDRLKKELGKVQRYLEEQNDALRFPRSDQLHITLAFLGRVSAETIETISTICQSIATQSTPFTLSPTQLGSFPRVNRPSVVWIGLGGDTNRLERITLLLETELSRHHILPIRGAGGFSAHITLARVDRKRRRHSLFAIRNLLEDTVLDLSDLPIPVREIVLYQSNRSLRGPAYIPLKTFPLERD